MYGWKTALVLGHFSEEKEEEFKETVTFNLDAVSKLNGFRAVVRFSHINNTLQLQKVVFLKGIRGR